MLQRAFVGDGGILRGYGEPYIFCSRDPSLRRKSDSAQDDVRSVDPRNCAFTVIDGVTRLEDMKHPNIKGVIRILGKKRPFKAE
jgi:hypothetical protein